eukprot:1893107-Alexandrium_andersonii.AAC.1
MNSTRLKQSSPRAPEHVVESHPIPFMLVPHDIEWAPDRPCRCGRAAEPPEHATSAQAFGF